MCFVPRLRVLPHRPAAWWHAWPVPGGVLMILVTSTALAQQARVAKVPPPQDTPYPGTIALHVDASDTTPGHLPRARDDPGARPGP